MAGMYERVGTITRRYMDEGAERLSLSRFAGGLGVKVSRMTVANWRHGRRGPNYHTLAMVRQSPVAADWARAWASDVLQAYDDAAAARLEKMEKTGR